MPKFLRRIWDRKLVQWALAYLAGAWVLLQATTLVGQHFGWPGWVHRALIALAAVGLMATLVVAWYHGEKGRQRVSGPELLMLAALLIVAGAAVAVVTGPEGSARTPGPPGLRAGGAGASDPGGDMAAAAAGSRTRDAGSSPPAGPAPASARSVAVLPFENLSANPSDEYFSDGITEDVLTALAKIGDLHVISRTSSMAYKGTDKTLREIGRELGAATIVEGSVRRQGDRVRIVAQLVDARDDRHVWAETYDRDLTDIFAIQSEIAEAIASALEAELTETERSRITAGNTANLDAYDLYLRGREHFRDPAGGREGNEAAIREFLGALRLDPQYALAHAGLSMAYSTRQEYRGPVWGDSAILSAARAITRDPRAAEGYVAMARAQGYWGLRDQVAGNLRLALERNPNHPGAVTGMAILLEERGRLDDALGWALRAVSLEPTYAPHYSRVGWILVDLGAEEAGRRWLQRHLELEPDDPGAYADFVHFHLNGGRVGRAEEYLEKMRAVDPETGFDVAADVATEQGDLESALAHLERWWSRQSAAWETQDLLGWVQMRLGRRDEAERSLRQAEDMARLWLGRGDQGAWPYFVLARVHLARGETDEAIDALERWVERGGYEPGYLRTSRVFAPLRSHPRFRALLERVEGRVARMREAVGADTVMPPGRSGA